MLEGQVYIDDLLIRRNERLNKTKIFEQELSWIWNAQIREFAEKLIECAPDYFFEVAASSTGKFHPSYALGPGGLVRHTKAAAKILHELLALEMFNKYSCDQKDMMLTAIMAHDFFKHGLASQAGKYTVAEHPMVCANFIRDNAELTAMLTPEQIDFICGCIASHMGQWNTDYRSKKEIMPKPKTGPQNFVHLADYLASRKYLLFDFGDDYYEPTKEEESVADNSELDALKQKIVELCKSKIDAGVAQKDLYAIVAAENNGNRNPNSVTTVETARNILTKVEELNV